MTCTLGFGEGPWGSAPWGGGAGFSVTYAVAVRENVIRAEFSDLVYWSRLFDFGDASIAGAYTVEPADGSVDDAGEPARPVLVASVALSDATGRRVDVAVDRPLSAFPATYVLRVAGVKSMSGEDVDGCSVLVHGVRRAAVPMLPQLGQSSAGDFANPPTPDGNLGAGTFGAAGGDYANVVGVASLRKRVIRRLVTRKGAFSHLPGYGIGVGDYVKTIARGDVRARLVADAEQQIASEPDVKTVKVTLSDLGGGAWWLRVQVVPTYGDPVDVAAPMDAFATG